MNPILAREVRARWRDNRSFYLLFALPSLLCIAIWIVYQSSLLPPSSVTAPGWSAYPRAAIRANGGRVPVHSLLGWPQLRSRHAFLLAQPNNLGSYRVDTGNLVSGGSWAGYAPRFRADPRFTSIGFRLGILHGSVRRRAGHLCPSTALAESTAAFGQVGPIPRHQSLRPVPYGQFLLFRPRSIRRPVPSPHARLAHHGRLSVPGVAQDGV